MKSLTEVHHADNVTQQVACLLRHHTSLQSQLKSSYTHTHTRTCSSQVWSAEQRNTVHYAVKVIWSDSKAITALHIKSRLEILKLSIHICREIKVSLSHAMAFSHYSDWQKSQNKLFIITFNYYITRQNSMASDRCMCLRLVDHIWFGHDTELWTFDQ